MDRTVLFVHGTGIRSERLNRWSILEFDPLYELRMLGLRAGDVVDLQPGHPGAELRRELHLLALAG